MRRNLIEADLIECVPGLGPNLFCNSPMEACVVVRRAAKDRDRKDRVLVINAVSDVIRERGQSLLTHDHIERIVGAHRAFEDDLGLARVARRDEIRSGTAT